MTLEVRSDIVTLTLKDCRARLLGAGSALREDE